MKKPERPIQEVTVIGGGTAGWLSALYARHMMPTKVITLIESDEIGIIGAGEGSTPHFVDLLNILDIPIDILFKEAGATFKNSIKFTNWNNEGDEDFYHHSFKVYGNASMRGYQQDPRYMQDAPSMYVTASSANINVNQYDLAAKLSKENKVPFFYDPRKEEIVEGNSIYKFENIQAFALHFDAVRLAQSLKKIALSRGILLVEGIVESFTQDANKDVRKLILKDGKEIKTDFIFDCSGFNKFFPNKFNSKWKSYKDKLPVNSAIPFFLPMEEDGIPPHTEAIAMKHGWIWKIPLQERYGCGYVFDSTLINAEEAQEEVESYLGFKIDVPRVLTFEPGYYETPWVHNVISLGLCSGFVEPLEATSIQTTIISLSLILTKPQLLHKFNQDSVDDYNKAVAKINDNIMAFIYFHYMSQRDDTEFWKKFKNNPPESVQKFLDISKFRLIGFGDMSEEFWGAENWYAVALGLHQFNIVEHSKEAITYSPLVKELNQNFLQMVNVQDEVVRDWCVDHKQFIGYLKGEKAKGYSKW